MNPLKTIIAGVAIFSTAISAYAAPSTDATIVRITGSTAFRAAAHASIIGSFDTTPNPPVAAFFGNNLSGASQSFFYGTIGGQEYIVTTSWSGSVGGIRAVTTGNNINFLPDTLADAPGLALASAGGSSQTTVGANPKAADVAMSDTFQSATLFKTPELKDEPVGVIGFKWLTNRGNNLVSTSVTYTAGSPILTMASTAGLSVGMTVSSSNLPTALLKIQSIDSATQVTLTSGTGVVNTPTATVTTTFVGNAITNINSQAAQALWTNGKAALSQFTGNVADNTSFVYATGRDPDSGTRLTAFAESGVGVNSSVTQYKPTVDTGTKSITGVTKYPVITINGIEYGLGASGESSGSTLAGYFGNTSTALSGVILGYVGASDAPSAVNAGAKELTYNGVAYSEAAIKEGLYTFWCYEHVLYPNSWTDAAAGTPEAKKKVFVTAYVNQIKTVNAPIKLNQMNCSRSADGGVVFYNSF